MQAIYIDPDAYLLLPRRVHARRTSLIVYMCMYVPTMCKIELPAVIATPPIMAGGMPKTM